MFFFIFLACLIGVGLITGGCFCYYCRDRETTETHQLLSV